MVKALSDKCVCVLTASPLKFEETIRLAGIEEKIDDHRISRLKSLPSNNYKELKSSSSSKEDKLTTWVKIIKQEIIQANS